MYIFIKIKRPMEALEFLTKIKNNQIVVPAGIQSALEINKGKDIRVIVLIEDTDAGNYNTKDPIVEQTVQEQFLKGYADSDSVYDNFKV
jgi:bifunctional DNA-binding transcriptional regulator/antitoxin component of YhaV-PrlF toxin-antitoxin module